MSQNGPSTIAFAGRRIDAANAEASRFPASAEAGVAERLRDLFEESGARSLVASAACGADILALEAAGELGIRRYVILPFEPPRFRESSVTDRPGDWGPRYDAILESVDPDDIINLRLAAGAGAYDRTNNQILEMAIELAGRPAKVLGVIAWNGESRGDGDLTEQFARRARARGIEVREVDTTGQGAAGRS